MSANLPAIFWSLEVRAKSIHSDDQRTLLVQSWFGSHMLDPVFPVGAKEIKAQAVGSLIDLIDQILPESGPLGRINDTFKHRELHPLAEISTRFGYPTESALTAGGGSRYIVADKDKHIFPYFHKNGG